MSPRPVPDDAPASSRLLPQRRKPRHTEDLRPEVPDYEILRRIGTGAYGEVWLARSVAGTYRAVKVLWREDFEDDAVFIREFEGAQAYEPVARDIPGLVHILHMGRRGGEHACYYYVMELADDAYTSIHIEPAEYQPRSLHSDMSMYGKRPMPLDYVLEVGIQLAHALAGLHANDLTHRDVKPANVIFVNGRAKLADAGLVGLSGQRSYVGTEGYIPPDGQGSPRADVYALAKVLYEMATGKDRLDFPALPEEMPEETKHLRWLKFNDILCAAASPQPDKNSIVTAQALAEKLEELRDGCTRRAQKRGGRSQGKALLLGSAALLALLGGATLWLIPPSGKERLKLALAVLQGKESPTAATPQEESKVTAKNEDSEESGEKAEETAEDGNSREGAATASQLYIGSVPSGASIYTANGEYIDETPYGPVSIKAGSDQHFILRKEGYADMRVSGIAPKQGLLSLGGSLQMFCPPRAGMEWRDALGNLYQPKQGQHEAAKPVSAADFRLFMRQVPAAENMPFEEDRHSGMLRTSRLAINAYTNWLAELCEKEGKLGGEQSLVAQEETRSARGADFCGYRICTRRIRKTAVTIYTNPAGASVSYNGKLLGVTPMQAISVPQAPYYIEIRMPGHSSVTRSGLNPKGLMLNISLKPNQSVTFGSEWINSLGMKMVPFGSSYLVCNTEVRVADYHAFCRATGRSAPPRPDFEQNEHHPIVNVSRYDAEAFADWLSNEERRSGRIDNNDFYRLPSDEEWSSLLGLTKETGASPYERGQQQRNTDVEYPWGIKWPPRRGTGNFADLSRQPFCRSARIIPRYQDAFPFTAPVASFEPNELGLHDLDGNVQEWVSDSYGGPADFPFRNYGVTRGGDYSSFRPRQLRSSCRTPLPPSSQSPVVGFRLILERRSNTPH